MRLEADAPAKINRELRVGPVRPDGYHEVLSRIVAIELADRLEVRSGRGHLEFTCSGGAPPGEDNLVVRAARALAQRLDRPADARIHLEKRIPSGAGLGGGSADAAVTLLLLGRLWKSTLSAGETAQVAAGLGSDVPFFLYGGEARVSGRGEEVHPLPDGPEEDVLLLIPPFSISTAQVYAALSRRPAEPLPKRLDVDASGRFFGPNELALAVLETEVRMKEYVESARQASSDFAISGSGSTIVLRGAEPGAAAMLARRHPSARLIRSRTLTRGDYQRRTGFSGGS